TESVRATGYRQTVDAPRGTGDDRVPITIGRREITPIAVSANLWHIRGQMNTEFLTLYWWVSVVVVGLILNLASSYLKLFIDKILATVSSRWRRGVERKIVEFGELVQAHLNDPMLVLLTTAEATRLTVSSLLNLVLSLSLIGLVALNHAADPSRPQPLTLVAITATMSMITLLISF